MPITDDFEMLLSPIRLGAAELRNRVVTTAHSVYQPWAVEGSAKQYIEYCRRRAAGGVAMLICQPPVVEPYFDWPSPIADRFHDLAEAIHSEGGIAVLQVVNFGGNIGSAVLLGGRPMWSFNGGPDAFGESSHKMTSEEVQLIVDAYGRTAKIITEAGIDGIELHGAHGYLINQSYSLWGNGRDDQWGETMAFTNAVIDASRKAMAPGKILGFRTTANDLLRPEQGGQDESVMFEIANAVVDTGQVDFLDFSIGIVAPAYSQQAVASYRYPADFDIELAGRLRAAIGARIPVLGVGGVTRPENAEAALRSGACDLVGMTRANISDPEFVNKLKRGEPHRIRQCVRANECVDRRVDGKVVTCFHNLDVGREFLQASIKPTERALRIVIVGGGPAGLKAAETAVRRGHHPIVIDEQEEPGGRLRHVRTTAARSLYGSVQWLVQEIDIGGGEMLLGKRFDVDDVRNLEPEVLVLATGATPTVRNAFTGSDQAGVLTVDQAIESSFSTGQRVVVLDRMGSNEAPLLIETLTERGVEVLYVTPFERIATNAGYTHRLDLRDIFRRSPLITSVTEADIRSFADGIVTVMDPDGHTLREVSADAVVVANHAVPEISLHSAAGDLGVPTLVVGDGLAARGALVAMREAEDAVTAL